LHAVSNWKDGEPQAGLTPAKLSFKFEDINTDEGTARVVGPFGPSDIVVRDGPSILGWAAVSPTSSRACYAGVVEHSVYVAQAARGRGIGSQLLQELIRVTEAHGIWMIQSSIFPENLASLALHTRHGFRVVGQRERIARMEYGPYAGQWRDTVLIERRSTSVGR
jgi:phosphinothricin acetyltransferase